jgi:uncharacterized protein YqeY
MSDDGRVPGADEGGEDAPRLDRPVREGNRADLVERERAQIAIIEQYLPAQLSEAEIRSVVAEAIEEAGKAGKVDVGAVMKLSMAKLKGKAEGRVVQQIVGAMLKP